MQKKYKLMLIFSGIMALSVLFANIDLFIGEQQQMQQQAEPLPGNYAECMAGYGIEPSVVFVYSRYCPHCRSMIPIIKELEQEGYSIYSAEGSEQTELIQTCFSPLLSGYVPQFICPMTGSETTGEMSKEELKKFIESCS